MRTFRCTWSFIIPLILLQLGCGPTKFVLHDDDSRYTEINELGATKEAKVLLSSGEAYGCANLRVDADSTSFRVTEDYEVSEDKWTRLQARPAPVYMRVSNTDIRRIRFKERNRAAGAMVGGLLYGGVMLFSGVVFAHECTDDFDWFCLENQSKGSFVLQGTAGGAVLGGIIGGLIGRSDKTDYQMPGDPRAPSNHPERLITKRVETNADSR